MYDLNTYKYIHFTFIYIYILRVSS
jgi:hypothetical protein